MRRRALFVLVLLAAVFVGVGCDGDESPALADSFLTRASPSGEDEMTAIIGGTLQLDLDRHCVLLDGKPVVWPAETTLTIDPPELHLPGGRTARARDAIKGAGGELPAAGIGETSLQIHGDLTNALSCAHDTTVLVFSDSGDGIVVSREGSGDRAEWARWLGRASEVEDPVLVRRVERAARASGARAITVTVLEARTGQHVPVVSLEAADPAAYMKHHLRGFLDHVGYFEPDALGFVELHDAQGRFAWSAGRYPNGGMVHPRADLDACGPIFHSQPALAKPPPPCPAD